MFILILILIITLSFIYKKNFNKNYKSKPINILFITIDALRSDHLGCYGYVRDTTPNIDKLAKGGILFTQAISTASFTAASLNAVLFSVYPHNLAKFNPYSSETPTPSLAKVLRDNGYYTGLISNYDLLYYILRGIKKDYDVINIYKQSNNAKVVTRSAINFIQNNRSKPFFLWLHYFDPHGPYRPPSPYNKFYVYDNYYQKGKIAHILTNSKDKFFGFGGIPITIVENDITDLSYYISQYDGEIKFTDEQIGLVLKELRNLGLENNTLIIITADHGETLGDHNLYFCHSGHLYDDLLRVPLVIKFNKIFPKNKIITKQVQTIDIATTILEILQINIPLSFKGKSLNSLIKNNNSNFRTLAFAEAFMGYHIRAIRTDRWKLIYSESNKYELYDLKNDPKELNNIINIADEQFKLLKQELNNWFDKINPIALEEITPIDKTTREKLKSLGYLQ